MSWGAPAGWSYVAATSGSNAHGSGWVSPSGRFYGAGYTESPWNWSYAAAYEAEYAALGLPPKEPNYGLVFFPWTPTPSDQTAELEAARAAGAAAEAAVAAAAAEAERVAAELAARAADPRKWLAEQIANVTGRTALTEELDRYEEFYRGGWSWETLAGSIEDRYGLVSDSEIATRISVFGAADTETVAAVTAQRIADQEAEAERARLAFEAEVSRQAELERTVYAEQQAAAIAAAEAERLRLLAVEAEYQAELKAQQERDAEQVAVQLAAQEYIARTLAVVEKNPALTYEEADVAVQLTDQGVAGSPAEALVRMGVASEAVIESTGDDFRRTLLPTVAGFLAPSGPAVMAQPETDLERELFGAYKGAGVDIYTPDEYEAKLEAERKQPSGDGAVGVLLAAGAALLILL